MNSSEATLRQTTQPMLLGSVEEKDGIRYDSDFSRIEELIKGNTFTREEMTRLMEILNSRVEKEDEQKSSINAEGDAQMVLWMPEIPKTPSEGKQQYNERTMIGYYSAKSNAQAGVSASPIDIARAYMAGRSTDEGQDLHNFISNGERAQPNNEFVRKPLLLPSPSPKPSICWPGAVVHDLNGYTTPQSLRGRGSYRLHDFPRTPYSRSVLSKSKTKLQADTTANPSTPFQRSQTSPYGQGKSRSETVDAYGSVGPIRRIRNKIGSEVRPRGSIFQSSLKEVSPKAATAQVFGGFLPNAEKNVTQGEKSLVSKYWSEDVLSHPSDRGTSNTDISSSQAAKKVLELLDRNKPTPKQKEAELKLATAWRSSPDANNAENRTSSHVDEPASQNNSDITGLNFPLESDKSRSKFSILGNFPGKGMNEASNAAATGIAKASNSTPGAGAMPIFGLKGSSAPQSWNKNDLATTNHRQTETSSQFSLPPLSNGQKSKTSSEADALKNHGTKPSLALISTKRAEFRATSSENGLGFTFPVSASTGVLSEPPTPSIAPSFSATVTPSYSFGNRKQSEPSIVFSFPSTSNASSHEESGLKFSFGSDKKPRLCFSSFGKNSIYA